MQKLNLVASFSLCAAATFLVLDKLDYPLIGIDDANIYFVYARNLAEGHGFVYNVGGERVEGFTSILWTLIAALAFRYFAQPEVALLVFNIAIVSWGIAFTLYYFQETPKQEWETRQTRLLWSILFLVLLYSSPRYIVWNTITLMENGLWSTLLLVTTIFVIKDHRSIKEINLGFVPLALLLLVTRPESILWTAVFLTVLVLRVARRDGLGAALKALTPSIAGIVLGLLFLTLFRLLYFGYPLPNTYYAKVSPSFLYNVEQGALYLVRYLLSDPMAAIGILFVFLTCIFLLRKPRLEDGAFFLPFIAATGLLMPLLTGGDHFGSFRFYQNVYPITVLTLILALRSLASRVSKVIAQHRFSARFRGLIVPALTLFLFSGVALAQTRAWLQFAPEIQFEFRIAASERRKGAFLQELFSSLPDLPSVGVVASGGVKYSYPGEVVDLLGLNNTTMAHNRGARTGLKSHAAFEVRTFHLLQPDVVWPRPVDHRWEFSETELQNSWENTQGLKGLFDDTRFLESYTYAKIRKVTVREDGAALVAWFRKDFLAGLLPDENFLIEPYPYSP